MKRRFLNYVPFLTAAVIFLAGLLLVGHRSYETNDCHLVYTLDDPYLHMAIAKNLVLHGVFGLTQYGFSSSTSSPLWTLLVAATYKLIGVCDWAPGVWATLFALAVLYVTHSLCHLFGLKSVRRLIICCAVIYFTPLIPLVSTGMEHTMHLFFIIMLMASTVRFMESPSRKELMIMCLVGCLATASRYESLFLVAPIAISLLLTKRWGTVPPFVVSSLLPVTAYGLFSVSHGSYFLPNSLMLKGSFPHIGDLRSLFTSLGGRAFHALTTTPHMYSISILLLLGLYSFRKQSKSFNVIALSLGCLMVLHLQYASLDWFYRYEAYIVGAFMPILGCLYLGNHISLRRLMRDREYVAVIALLGGVLLLGPLNWRALAAIKEIVPASNHIYRQQYQMGHFLRAMYEPGVRVAVNDAGAVTYFADTDVLDLWGLGSIEVARAKLEHRYDLQAITNLLHTRRTDVVIIYTSWFENLLPDNLVAVCSWSTKNNYFGRTVTFFGTSDHNALLLKEKLLQYEKLLPDSVDVTYESTKQSDGHVR